MKPAPIALVVFAVGLAAGCSPAKAPDQDGPVPFDSAEPTASADPDASNPDLVKGRDLIEHQQFAEAIPVLEKVVAAQPKNADATYYLGLAYDHSGKRADAEAKYKAALELKPALVEAAQNLAAIYLEDPPRPDDAIPLLRGALKVDPTDAATLEAIAYAYGLKKDVDRSSEAYELALKNDDTFKVRYAYGSMLFENGKSAAAVTQLSRAAEATEDVPLLASIADMLGHAKSFDTCVKVLDRVIAKQPDAANFLSRRGECKHGKNDEPGAEADFRAAVKVDPKAAAPHYLLGQSLIVQKRVPEAKTELKTAYDLDKASKVGQLAKKILDSLK